MSFFIKIEGFVYRSLIFAKRNVFSIFEILFWPFISIISIGLMGNFLKFQGNVMNFVLTGAITSGVLQIAQLDVAYGMLYDVWSKSTKHTFLAPITHYHYILGGWIVGIIRGTIVFLLMYLFSSFYFKFNLPSLWGSAIFLAGIFLIAGILGMVVCLLVFIFGSKVDVVAWSFVALIMIFCGIYYPVNTLPPAATFAAGLIPLTYFLDYFRSLYGFQPTFSHNLFIGFLESFLYIAIMFRSLQWAYNRACRTGMILRLSE